MFCICTHLLYIPGLHTHSLGIVESIPENLTYPSGSPSHLSTYDAWTRLLEAAKERVDIASFYWTLRGHGSNSDSTDWQVGQWFSSTFDRCHLFTVPYRPVMLLCLHFAHSCTARRTNFLPKWILSILSHTPWEPSVCTPVMLWCGGSCLLQCIHLIAPSFSF